MEGCPPCRKLKSLLPKWEAELMGMGVDRILICDKDEDRDVAKDLGCRAYPTVALVIDGKLVFRITGCPSKELLKSKVKEYIK
jgi:thioredoxin-like negative regulator of GroEL